MKQILVLSLKLCFFRLRMNTLTSRGELNWRRTRFGTNNKYEDLTHDEDVQHDIIHNDDGFFLIFMMVNDGFKGGRNDDHENVNRNSETPQKLFGTSGLLTFVVISCKIFGTSGLVLSIGLDSGVESLDS